MRFWTAVLGIAGGLLIIIGILFFLFLLALNDPDVEGDSGRVHLGAYFISLIPITIGSIIVFNIFLRKRKE